MARAGNGRVFIWGLGQAIGTREWLLFYKKGRVV